MVKKNRKKQAAVPYEFIQEVNKMSKDEIVKRFILEENDLKAMKKIKREDEQISELASQIKHKEENIKDKIDALKEKMKAIREEDEEFVELKENKKALEGGYRDEMKRRRAYRDYLYETMQKIYQE
jgi:CRISPR/Cas system-associated exonuclease Cas4 (RecB family)